MTLKKTRQHKGIILVPDNVTLESIEGEIKVGSVSKEIETYLDGAARTVVTEDQAQTLTNKTIDIDNNTVSNIEVDNLKSGVLNTSTTLTGATDLQVPSALAVKTYVDDELAGQNEASEISVTPAGTISSTNVQAALQELDTDIQDHITDTTDAHDASAISNVPAGSIVATTVQAAINELDGDVVAAQGDATQALSDASDAQTDIDNHISDTSDAHDASAISFSPVGAIVATDVQAAVAEVDSDLTTHISDTSTHGVSGDIVGTSDSQTLTNKTITGADFRTPVRSDVKQDTKANLTTYALSASNGQLVFATDTKEMFQVVDTLLEAVGGAGGAADVNALLIQTFDTAAISDFTQTGLSLTSTNTINGAQSAALTHGTGASPANDKSFKQVIAVDRKFRSQQMTLSLSVRSTATSGNLTVQVQDETNAVSIMASSQIATSSNPFTANTNSNTTLNNISNADMAVLAIGDAVTGSGIPVGAVITALGTNQVTISAAASATASAVSMRASALPTRRPFTFVIPANCASLSYTVTALPEANSPRSVIDDVVIELTSNSLLETSVTVPNITAWQAYTPTFTGFGTPSAIEFEWRQVGENVEIRGKFTSGTPTAVEARVSLPNGYTSAGTGVIPSLSIAGVNSFSNAVSVVPLIEPSVSYITLGTAATSASSITKSNANTITASGGQLSFLASVPCSGLTATSDVAIPLTQSGIVQEADSMIRVDTVNGYGSTNTCIRRFTNITQSIGSDVSYVDSATLGASFTILTTGTYSISFVDVMNSAGNIGISKNSTQLTSGITTITTADRLATATIHATNYSAEVSWTGYLVAGDIIRPHCDTTASGLPTAKGTFVVTKQGSLKQVTVNTNSKITIPTSELRFEGASARGAVATAIVKFDTMAKIRGDAFTVTNTANDGTYVTMTKAGKLDISSSLALAATNSQYISRNQASLTTALPAVSEILATSGNGTGANSVDTCTWSGFVSIGDILRVSASIAPISVNANNMSLAFQEQDIQVSVSNTLPQFSESDSSVRLDTADGYGSTNTMIRRFSNLQENIGTDIVYTDSATNGASFRVLTSGIYDISFTDDFSGAQFLGLSKNSIALTTSIASISVTERLAMAITSGASNPDSISWTGYLVAGDIIRPHNSGQASGVAARTAFTMSKVGKPNVTGVDVTPFVNVPMPEQGTAVRNYTSLLASNVFNFNTIVEDKNINNFLSYDSTTGKWTALKRATADISFFLMTVNGVSISIDKNDSILTSTDSGGSTIGGYFRVSGNSKTILEAGETFRIRALAAPGTIYSTNYLSIEVTALSDQILTAPETFSTDTAALTYAGSGTYTLATLANAPVGTFITYAITGSTTDTAVQTNSAPTQTTADMAVNGIRLYNRIYSATSTAALPAKVAIQIGKGLKGMSLNLYRDSGKLVPGSMDLVLGGTNSVQLGFYGKHYNETTGILTLDVGSVISTSVSNNTIYYDIGSSITSQTNGYVVINASKNPALTGLNINTVAGRGVNVAGTSVANAGFTKMTITGGGVSSGITVDTTNSRMTALSSGTYEATARTRYATATYALGDQLAISLYKNGVFYSELGAMTIPFAGAQGAFVSGTSDLVPMNVGDYLEIFLSNSRTAGATALNTSAGMNFFTAKKISIG